MSQKTKETPSPAEMGEFSVTDELYEISEATNKDGTVDVSIYDFEKRGDDKVTVRFYTPAMSEQSETMDWPRKDTLDYKFVRICRATVGGLSGAEWLKTDGAKIKADPDDWKIKAELPKTTEVKHSIANTTGSDILEYIGISLFAIWALGIATILIGAPIVSAATLLGIVGAATGLYKLWVAAFIAMIITLIILPDDA